MALQPQHLVPRLRQRLRRASVLNKCAGDAPLAESEVRISVMRNFVENAISSLKRLGTRAYPTQERRALPQCSEGRRISFSHRGLRSARGIRFAVFQKDSRSVQNV